MDSSKRVVGYVKNGKFQLSTEAPYKSGLLPIEMEQIAEVIQRSVKVA
jgi:hypothetical protein